MEQQNTQTPEQKARYEELRKLVWGENSVNAYCIEQYGRNIEVENNSEKE